MPSVPRLGQLLATTLPSNHTVNENSIDLYDDDEASASSKDTDSTNHSQFGRFRGVEGKQQRAIVLRNILLDVLISLLTRNMELNSQYVHSYAILRSREMKVLYPRPIGWGLWVGIRTWII